jgi:transglutaminase-like putative cysteine protease
MLLGAAAPLAAFGQFQAPTADELKMTSDPKAPGADAVFLNREETENDPQHYKSYYARIKVLTEKGKELATVRIGYEKNFAVSDADDKGANRDKESPTRDIDLYNGHFEVAAISARTIHPDGTVIPLPEGQAADLLSVKSGNTQVNTVTLNLPSVEVGSILEYRYQLRYDRFYASPQWQVQIPYFVHKEHYLFRPSEVYLPNHAVGGSIGGGYFVDSHGDVLTDLRAASVLPLGKTVQEDAQGQWVLDVTDVPPIPREAFSPALEGQIYQVAFYYTFAAVSKDFWQKGMQFWIKNVDQYTAPTDAIRQAVAATVSSSDNQIDKARKLYDLVQKFENTDYSGNSAKVFSNDLVPAGNAEAVLQRKSGNSKEIALLYLALARAAGLDARPERIASRNHRIFDVNFQNTEQLDAVVIGVTVNAKEVLVDPACKMAPFQTLHWSHTGAAGVALGADGKIESIITPLQDNQENTTIRVGSLTIGPEGSVSGSLKVGFVGQEALKWRQRTLRATPDAVKTELERELQRQVPEGTQIHIDHISGLDDPGRQLVAVLSVTGMLGTRTGSHLALPRLFFDSKAEDPFPPEDSRTLPVDAHFAAQEQEQIAYIFPSGFTLEGTPQDSSMRWEENAAYKLIGKADANSLTSARILARGFTILPATEYGKLRDFYDKVALADRQQIALKAAGK